MNLSTRCCWLLWGPAAVLALLGPRGLADSAGPRAPTEVSALAPLEPTLADPDRELLYGAAEDAPFAPPPLSDPDAPWLSSIDRVSLLEIVTGEPDVPDFYHTGSCREPCCPECRACCQCNEPWEWSLIPEGLIYRSYQAGPKESRFGSVWFSEQTGEGSLWDIALGGRVGVLRFGNRSPVHPEGWQLDIEGAAFPRLDITAGRRDLVSADYRFGIPLTYGLGRYQMKFAYYHLSSHLGDEFIERTGAQRINYVRDALVWGHSYFLTPDARSYAEIGYSYNTDGGAEPWEIQFGLEFAPPCPTGVCGAPFLAINALLQEEHDFGGMLTLQAGWAWRNAVGRLFRVGLHYHNGKSPQYEFFDRHEEQIGVGIWYDY
jgi:hypothetical protein